MTPFRLIISFGILLYPVAGAQAQNYYEEQFSTTAEKKAQYKKFYDPQFMAEQKAQLSKEQSADPRNPAPTGVLAEITARQGNLMSALDGLSTAINMNSDDNGAGYSRDWLYLDRAVLKSQLGLVESALSDCDSAFFLSSQPDHWRVYWLKSIILERSGRAKEAEEQLKLAQQNARTVQLSNEFFSKKLFARTSDNVKNSSLSVEPASTMLSSLSALTKENKLPSSSVLQQTLSISWLPQNLNDHQTYRPDSTKSPLVGLSIDTESKLLSLGINADACGITELDLNNQFHGRVEADSNRTGEPEPWQKVVTVRSGACLLEFTFAHNKDQGVQNIVIRWNQPQQLGQNSRR